MRRGLRYAARLRSKPAATTYPKVEATDYTSRPKQKSSVTRGATYGPKAGVPYEVHELVTARQR